MSAIPGASPLLLDYLSHSTKVENYYLPFDLCKPYSGDYPNSRREQVAATLKEQNMRWKASDAALQNIERLRQGASALVTGQQVILFGGPLFTIYKALTAIKLAAERTAKGQDTVPIFWLATTDHDLAEVDHIYLLTKDRQLLPVRTSADGIQTAPVANLALKDVEEALTQFASLHEAAEVTEQLRASYREGATFADAFATFFARLFADFGLILLDPSDKKLQQIAQPVYIKALDHSAELNQGLQDVAQQLEASGYHAQVKVSETSTLLFKVQDGRRLPVQAAGEADFRVGDQSFPVAQLRGQIEANPELFSGNALLRPVVQDFLLPTAAYVGGPAEIAYLAQSGLVYDKILGVRTPVLSRFSATLMEPKIRTWLELYQLSLPDVFVSSSELARRLASAVLPNDLQATFDSSESKISEELLTLVRLLDKLDPSLSDAAQTSLQKMKYQLQKLRTRAADAELRKNGDIIRHAQAVSNSLFPDGAPQERNIAAVSFFAKYGNGLLHQLYAAINPLSVEHHILYL